MEHVNIPRLGLIFPTHYSQRDILLVKLLKMKAEIGRNCEAFLSLVSKTEGCQWLSTGERALAWENGESQIHLRARNRRSRFHLAFSQEIIPEHQFKRISYNR